MNRIRIKQFIEDISIKLKRFCSIVLLKLKQFLENMSIKLEQFSPIVLFSFILFLGIIIIFLCSIIFKKFGIEIDMQAITGFLSVCVSAGAFYVTNSENKRDKKVSQATVISCWLLRNSKKDEKQFVNEKNQYGGFYFVPRRAVIQNASRLPVYDVFIFSMTNRSDDKINNLYKQFDFVKYIEILPPGENIQYVKTGGSSMGGVRSRVAIIFRDSNYKWWYRGPQGKLVRAKQKTIDKLVNTTGIYYPLFDQKIYKNTYLNELYGPQN